MATYKPKYTRPIKYPPGTVNIDIISLIFVLLIVGFILYLTRRYWFDYHENKRIIVGMPATSYIPISSSLLRSSEATFGVMPLQMGTIGGISTRLDVLNDPYIPPVKMDGYTWSKTSSDVRGLPPIISPIEVPITPTCNISSNSFSNSSGSEATFGVRLGPAGGYLPVNVETRGIRSDYSQIGILTKSGGGSNKFSKRKMFSDDMPDDGWEGSETRLILPLMGRRSLTGRDKWQYYTMSNTGVVNTKLPIKIRGRNCSSEYGCDEITDGDMVYVQGYNHGFQATVYENATFSYIPVL